jgi:hypothetical protein
VLVTPVQGVIGTLDEDFSPLNKRGREETSDRAEDYLLEKSRVHRPQRSSDGARAT